MTPPHLIPLPPQPSCWPWARRASTAAASTRNVMRWPITCGAASTEGAGGDPRDPPGDPWTPRDQQEPPGTSRTPSPTPLSPPQSPLPAAIKCPCGESLWVRDFRDLGAVGEPRCVAGTMGCGSALHPGRRRPPRIPGSKGAAVPQGDKVHDGAGVTPQHPPRDLPPDSQEAKLGGRGFIGGLHSWQGLHQQQGGSQLGVQAAAGGAVGRNKGAGGHFGGTEGAMGNWGARTLFWLVVRQGPRCSGGGVGQRWELGKWWDGVMWGRGGDWGGGGMG